MNFKLFARAIAQQFQKMTDYPMYRTSATKDIMWKTYLESFPPGTNPIYRERTEHDCSICMHFIASVGNVVAIIDGEIQTIWDIEEEVDDGYQVVAYKMSEIIKSHPIVNVFLHDTKTVGAEKTFETIVGTENKITYDHFYVRIPNKFVVQSDRMPTALSGMRTDFEVFKRALKELTQDSVETILELIGSNSIYRGKDYENLLTHFLRSKIAYAKSTKKELFVWEQVQRSAPAGLFAIRNTAIGSLLLDLSDGRPLEESVTSFEAKVAPSNYKRPTALVTNTMVTKAKETVESLGLLSALERRFATEQDITVNNVLFANNAAKESLDEDIFATLAVPTFLRVEEMSIDDFVRNILPTVHTLELLVENKHKKNLVTLLTAADPTSEKLFKWDNPFSWSYVGEFADSIKAKVQKAGGSIIGDVCCRLAWYNYDDLDLHMYEPDDHISYRNKRSRRGGCLDVDMNAGPGQTREPVENIFYASKSMLQEGIYTLSVNQFTKRENSNVGFDVEVDLDGMILTFSYGKALRNNQTVEVLKFAYNKKTGFTVLSSLAATARSTTFWGIETNKFTPVKILMQSPNHWDGEKGIGNKHYFFFLDGCECEDSVRGFYNEFLRSDLEQHRKVFETLGGKLSVEKNNRQLSGLGFSVTAKNDVVVKVTGKTTRTIKIRI